MIRIALFIESSHGYTRRMIRGVRDYLEERPDWLLHCGPPTREGIAALRAWRPAGILAHFSHVPPAALYPLGCPVVSLGVSVPVHPRMTSVYWDRHQAGETAGRYFLERGFQSFAFFGGLHDDLARARLAGLRRVGEGAGFRVAEMWTGRRHSEAFWRWPEPDDGRVGAWLAILPKPVAVMCSNDALGRDLVEIAAGQGLRVPQEVAILGSSNDDLICELSRPPLSSIEAPHERLGRRAAELLAALMASDREVPAPEAMAGFQVVTRASTDILAAAHPAVKAALETIQKRFGDPTLGVWSICRAVGVSRRTLERRFQATLHRSIGSEIRRLRLDRVEWALRQTDAPLARVARECGFSSAQRLHAAYRQYRGRTPGHYRVQFRKPA